jgi:DNA processing protein
MQDVRAGIELAHPMTLDQAVALSLLDNLSRVGLTERLRHGDSRLVEQAAPLLARARDCRLRAADQGIQVLPWNDPRFPVLLLAISDCPPLLWYRGTLDALNAPLVAIVGSRAASPVALETGTTLAADLAGRGVTVVSGLARGVDSAAHRGALRAGRTIAVLGSGLRRPYPPDHAGLADQIAATGLVVSEYPPSTPPLPFRFPMRNRLISGLSLGVVVIEASDRSGSLITAACALDQGRDVMVVPGSILGGRNRGGHALIRDGARIVESGDDIALELGLAQRPIAASGPEEVSGSKSATSDPVLRRLAIGHAYDVDTLTEVTGLETPRLLRRLLDLELRGLIHRLEAGRFVRRA